MSTRCNIIVKDKYDKFWLYHHCDGYPEGVGADLKKRLEKMFAEEYANDTYWATDVVNILIKDVDDTYELTNGEHGDIEYLYTIDLDKKELYYRQIRRFGLNREQLHKVYLIGGV